MSKRFIVRQIAEDRNLTEAQLLERVLKECNHEQKRVAEQLGVSQATVSEALKRNQFVRKQVYVKETA